MKIGKYPADGELAPAAHESTHVAGGADDIDSALAIAAMANLTSTMIWQGNVGNRPVEVAMSAASTFTELEGLEQHTVTSADTWEDYDLATIVPSGTKYVLVAVNNRTGVKQKVGARKNGTSTSRSFGTFTLASSELISEGMALMLTEVDANRVIEIYAGATASFHFGIKGYWA